MPWSEMIQERFPTAQPAGKLVAQSGRELIRRGFTPDDTLLAHAFCRDEVNAPVLTKFEDFWGETFNLSGLGGYPTAGRTGFAACASHVPDGGNLFVVYGPHIGISSDASFGKLRRRGMKHDTTCCGALVGFLGKIQQSRNYFVMRDPLDADMNTLEEALLPSTSRVLEHASPLLELTQVTLEVIERQIKQIIHQSSFNGRCALLGGVIINTPHPAEDWFAPISAELINAEVLDQPWFSPLSN